ncbi:hypothetical protein Tco_0685489 [Tanacetum coccineum]
MQKQTPSGSGSLPSNTVANPRGDMKAINTRSGVAYDGPMIPPTPYPLPKEVKRKTEATKDKVQTTNLGSTAHVQPSVVQVLIPESDVAPKPNPKPLHFDLSFADALLHIPKFASTFKSLLSNKEKLFELANTPLNENCSAVLLKKLPEKLGDPESALFDPFPPRIGDADFDSEGEILLLKKLLNGDPSSPLHPKELNFEELKMIKTSIDDSPPLEVLGGNFMIFSNLLFDSNDDFTSSDDESLPEEDVQEENFKIYSNPLFEFDDEYISSDVNPLFNEVLEDIESKDSYVSNFDEPALLVTPLSDANEDECFDPGGDIDEIDAFLDIDVSTDIEDGYHDSEGDIIYLESLLINNNIPNLPPEVFLYHDPRSLKNEPDNDDLKSMVKVFDPGIYEKIISLTYVRLPFEDRHYFSLTFVIRIFLPYLTNSMDSSLLLSSGSEDTIFDPGILIFSCYSLKPMVSH